MSTACGPLHEMSSINNKSAMCVKLKHNEVLGFKKTHYSVVYNFLVLSMMLQQKIQASKIIVLPLKYNDIH